MTIMIKHIKTDVIVMTKNGAFYLVKHTRGRHPHESCVTVVDEDGRTRELSPHIGVTPICGIMDEDISSIILCLCKEENKDLRNAIFKRVSRRRLTKTTESEEITT